MNLRYCNPFGLRSGVVGLSAFLLLLANPIEALHEAMVHHFITDKHCVIGMHHMKSLEASVSVLHRVYGAMARRADIMA